MNVCWQRRPISQYVLVVHGKHLTISYVCYIRFDYLFHLINIINLTETFRYIDKYKCNFLYTAINNYFPHQMVCGIQRYVSRSKSVGDSKWLSSTISVWQETIVKLKHENIYGMKWVRMCHVIAFVLCSIVLIPVLFIRALNIKILLLFHLHNQLHFNQMCNLFFKMVLSEYQYIPTVISS